jgi:hypothetical protein
MPERKVPRSRMFLVEMSVCESSILLPSTYNIANRN